MESLEAKVREQVILNVLELTVTMTQLLKERLQNRDLGCRLTQTRAEFDATETAFVEFKIQAQLTMKRQRKQLGSAVRRIQYLAEERKETHKQIRDQQNYIRKLESRLLQAYPSAPSTPVRTADLAIQTEDTTTSVLLPGEEETDVQDTNTEAEFREEREEEDARTIHLQKERLRFYRS